MHEIDDIDAMISSSNEISLCLQNAIIADDSKLGFKCFDEYSRLNRLIHFRNVLDDTFSTYLTKLHCKDYKNWNFQIYFSVKSTK